MKHKNYIIALVVEVLICIPLVTLGEVGGALVAAQIALIGIPATFILWATKTVSYKVNTSSNPSKTKRKFVIYGWIITIACILAGMRFYGYI